MTWADVSWLALYCRKLKVVFMSVNIPTDFRFGWMEIHFDERNQNWIKEQIYNGHSLLSAPFVFPAPIPFPVWPKRNGAFWRNVCLTRGQTGGLAIKVQTLKKLGVVRQSMGCWSSCGWLTVGHINGWHSLCHGGVDRTWVRRSSICWSIEIELNY